MGVVSSSTQAATPESADILATLDEHELALLSSLIAGTNVVELGEEAGYSRSKIHRDLQVIYHKLGVENRSQAIAVATRAGLTPPA